MQVDQAALPNFVLLLLVVHGAIYHVICSRTRMILHLQNHGACAQIEYSSLFDGQPSVSLPHSFLGCWHGDNMLL